MRRAKPNIAFLQPKLSSSVPAKPDCSLLHVDVDKGIVLQASNFTAVSLVYIGFMIHMYISDKMSFGCKCFRV